MSVTEEIKNRLDIVDIVAETVSLRKSGRSYAGFCPFHPNTRTPSFYVFPETQTWRCFGACAEGGDLFSFVMKKEGWEFRQALQYLARRAGITLESHQPGDKVRQAAEQRLMELLTAAADYYHMLLLYAPEAEEARRYVQARQLTQETLETFRIGFALDGWDRCRTHFNEQGYSDDDLLAAGLLTQNEERGTRYDRFRNRLMIPIRNVDGRVVGFGARTLEKEGIPKYLNSPQTPLFNKSHLLFGLDLARRHIREARQVVIVEGYMDVMQGWQQGYRNMVAQMGTALTEQQLQLLKRFTKRFVLALDADAAGAKATLRGLQVARETLDHELEVRFDARGLVRHEARLQADIRVVTLPPGNDPDKLLRTEPEKWPQLLAAAQPVVAYVIQVLTREMDKGDAKAKTAVARQVIPLIQDISDPVERDHYWQQLARALGTDERALRQIRLDTPRPPRPTAGAPAATVAPKDRATIGQPPQKPEMPPWSGEMQPASRPLVRPFKQPTRESNFLRQCLAHPQVVRAINQQLRRLEQPVVSEEDFTLPEDRAIWRQIMQAVIEGTFVTDADLCDSLDIDDLQNHVQGLRAITPVPAASLNKLPDTLVLSVLQWRQDQLKTFSLELTQLVQGVEDPLDAETMKLYQARANELRVQKLQLDRAIASMSAMQQRREERPAGVRR